MAQVADIQGEIKAFNERFMTTFKNQDAAGMAELYTGSGQLLPPQSDSLSGKDAIGSFWQAVMDMGIRNVKLESQHMEHLGETVIDIGRYTLYLDNDQVADRGKYLVTLRREGDGWKLHHDIWNTSVSQG